jgi:hypothetical protein
VCVSACECVCMCVCVCLCVGGVVRVCVCVLTCKFMYVAIVHFRHSVNFPHFYSCNPYHHSLHTSSITIL